MTTPARSHVLAPVLRVKEHLEVEPQHPSQAAKPTIDYEVRRPRGDALGWILSFLFFPYGPFVYLAVLRAISAPLAGGLLLATLAIRAGLVTALALTNSQAWQPWLVLLLYSALIAIGAIQYLLGKREGVWSRLGGILWMCAAILLTGALLAGAGIMFHLRVGL